MDLHALKTSPLAAARLKCGFWKLLQPLGPLTTIFAFIHLPGHRTHSLLSEYPFKEISRAACRYSCDEASWICIQPEVEEGVGDQIIAQSWVRLYPYSAWLERFSPEPTGHIVLTATSIAPKQKGQKMDLGTFLTDTCMPPRPRATRRLTFCFSPGLMGRRDGRYADA